MLSKIIAIAFVTVSAVDGTSLWSFSWPYGSDGQCKCVESETGTFKSQSECEITFAKQERETCIRKGIKPFSHSQCDFIVSQSTDVTNDQCKLWCEDFRDEKSSRMTISEMMRKCDFQFYQLNPSASKSGVAIISKDPRSCYDNLIYGFGDISPYSSLPVDETRTVIGHLPNAQSCQSECQNSNSCERWSLKLIKTPQHDITDVNFTATTFEHSWPFSSSYIISSSTSNVDSLPVYSCILYTKETVKGAAKSIVKNIMTNKINRSKYCDVERASLCPLESTGFASQETSPCLFCGDDVKESVCVFKSPSHISGPRFCVPEYLTAESKCGKRSSKSSDDDSDHGFSSVTEAEMSTTSLEISTTGLKISEVAN